VYSPHSLEAVQFIHTATASNITSNWTVIDNPVTNNHPDAILLVTPNWNPGGGGGVYNDHAIGVWYTGTRWAIFNQDIAAMPEGAHFNVLVAPAGPRVFVHNATADNIASNCTRIDSSLTNGHPEAIVLVTPNWNPGGGGGSYNNHPIGVIYNDDGQWAVFNQDMAHMPEGAHFNVFIAPADPSVFVHTATASNIAENWTVIDHPLTNGRPNAIVLATSNWKPGGGWGGTYDNHAIGVGYDGTRWTVFNQDMANMPEGAHFNVMVFQGTTKVYLPMVLRAFP